MHSLSAISIVAVSVNKMDSYCDISFLFPSIFVLKVAVRVLTCHRLYYTVEITSYGY